MPATASHPKTYAEILHSVFDLTGRGLNKPLAEAILKLDFPPQQAARIAELNEKANEGTLSVEETAELEAYLDVVDLLAYWQSSAHQFLTPHRNE